MFQTKRFGLVASKQEYLMLCHAECTLKYKKKPTGQHLSAFKVRKQLSKEARYNATSKTMPTAWLSCDG